MALVIKEEIDDAVNYMFPTDEMKEEYSGLLQRIERIKEMLYAKDELLRNAKADGVGIFVLASYDKPLFPFYERSGSIGDGLETARMAGGAITAEYGKTLDVEESDFCHPTRWLM